MTIEITKSTKNQRDFITGRVGYFRIEWERLDRIWDGERYLETWNATIVDTVYLDIVTDYLDTQCIKWRVV